MARSLSPEIYRDIEATLAEASNSVVCTLPGELTIDLVTREISIDLHSVEDLRTSRAARFESDLEVTHHTRIAFGTSRRLITAADRTSAACSSR